MGEEDDLGVLLPKDKLMHLKKNESVFWHFQKPVVLSKRLEPSGMVCGVSGAKKQGQSRT